MSRKPKSGGFDDVFSNPLAAMRQLQDLDAPPATPATTDEILTEVAEPESTSPAGDAQMRNGADAQMLEQARAGVSTRSSTHGSNGASEGVSTGALPHSLAEVREAASEAARQQGSKAAQEQARKDGSKAASARGGSGGGGGSAGVVAAVPLEDQVRDALAQKRTHGGGTKASVDMTPELSLRLKRYCLDHGNVTTRQLLIELASAFLEREGY